MDARRLGKGQGASSATRRLRAPGGAVEAPCIPAPVDGRRDAGGRPTRASRASPSDCMCAGAAPSPVRQGTARRRPLTIRQKLANRRRRFVAPAIGTLEQRTARPCRPARRLRRTRGRPSTWSNWRRPEPHVPARHRGSGHLCRRSAGCVVARPQPAGDGHRSWDGTANSPVAAFVRGARSNAVQPGNAAP